MCTDTTKDLIDHFSHYLTTEMDSDLIVQHMLSQQLLNDQEVHTIMNAASDYQKNCLVVENIRLMDTKCLVSFCKILQTFDSQNHISCVLINGKTCNYFNCKPLIMYVHMHNFTAIKSFGFIGPDSSNPQFTDTDISSANIKNHQPVPVSVTPVDSTIKSRKRPASSEELGSHKYFKPSLVNVEFLDMKVQLEQLLQTSSSQTIYEQCKSLMASHEHDISLFSTDYLSNLKKCSHISAILQRLSPCFNWSDHSVLHELVKACNNHEAAELLQQFESNVDLSLPITEYPVPQPVPSMAPYDASMQTVLAVKLNTELSNFSLQQVIELRSLIQKNFQITEHCLQLMAAKRSSTILYWMMTKCVSHLISSKIMQDSCLQGSRVQEVCVYPGTLFINVTMLKVGSLSFLNHVNGVS